MLEGKKILLGITGSIAAYKAAHLVRLLVKAGAEVQVLMTPAARDFVSPLTLATISRRPVHQDLFAADTWTNHVMLGRWADLMLIAPLSCNTLSKMAAGACDNLLLATYLSATCPVVIAPAMDEDMWLHPATKQNLATLAGRGHYVVPVGKGELASGLHGEGRMAEPEALLDYLEDILLSPAPLRGKKVLVTAGPTHEPIDPVRFIGNHSSGKMGLELAREAARLGADVTLVSGPSAVSMNEGPWNLVRVQTAAQMLDACLELYPAADLTLMAAAVADYTPAAPAAGKIKKSSDNLQLELVKTTDILYQLGQQKKAGQVLVGFALETDTGMEAARDKLQRKNADMIVLNSLRDEGAGFGHDTNKITIFDRDGGERPFALQTKRETARTILDTIIRKYYA